MSRSGLSRATNSRAACSPFAVSGRLNAESVIFRSARSSRTLAVSSEMCGPSLTAPAAGEAFVQAAATSATDVASARTARDRDTVPSREKHLGMELCCCCRLGIDGGRGQTARQQDPEKHTTPDGFTPAPPPPRPRGGEGCRGDVDTVSPCARRAPSRLYDREPTIG